MSTTPAPLAGELEAQLAATADRRLARYLDFLRIPSISGIPGHAADCRRAAEWLAGDLVDARLEHVEVSETGGHPVVYGEWLRAAGAPTVLLYGHYDVQPVDPLDEWEAAPFEPVIRGGRVLARGASDDKSNIAIAVAAVRALLETRGALPVNLKLLFEGEEESSSVHLDAWLAANAARLAADAALVADGGFFEGNLPAITVGLRGICAAEIHVRGPFQDVHSGSHGGAIDNPINALAGIIAALKGPDGRIRIDGFYDDVVPLSEAERAALAALPFDEEAYRAGLQVPALVGEAGWTTLERRGARPTLDVNGIWGGFSGEGSKTIIPGSAHAKVTCRLVADQDPARVFELLRAHVLRIAPPGVRVEVVSLGGGRPTTTPIDHPATRAFAAALEATFGRPPLFAREGGSVPVAASLASIVGLPVTVMGFMPPNGNFHAPNEWMDLANFEGGIRALVRFFDGLAAGSA
ncbi:MAG: dipeptidase [Chloroflexi bacterium]|nr:dipeptidase [Chloroflexota bacterium]MDA8237189.1 dipeptidase [Chloroflexota bacterium]